MGLKYRLKALKWNTKYLFQKLYRYDHIPDSECWNCSSYLVKIILPRIKAFSKIKRNGTPIFDSDISDEDREQKWQDILDKIVFAFEFQYQEYFDDNKAKRLRAKIKRKYGDWEEEIESNKQESFCKGEYFYYNYELYYSIYNKSVEGLKLFGEYLLNLWD
jgi:hypothetical protein